MVRMLKEKEIQKINDLTEGKRLKLNIPIERLEALLWSKQLKGLTQPQMQAVIQDMTSLIVRLMRKEKYSNSKRIYNLIDLVNNDHIKLNQGNSDKILGVIEYALNQKDNRVIQTVLGITSLSRIRSILEKSNIHENEKDELKDTIINAVLKNGSSKEYALLVCCDWMVENNTLHPKFNLLARDYDKMSTKKQVIIGRAANSFLLKQEVIRRDYT